MECCKIIRGYYLTGLGQEELAYYFKVTEEQFEDLNLKVGDIMITFYQNQEVITSIPALVRVASLITDKTIVTQYLNSEKIDGFPMLPIVEKYKNFDPIVFKHTMEMYQNMKEEITQLKLK